MHALSEGVRPSSYEIYWGRHFSLKCPYLHLILCTPPNLMSLNPNFHSIFIETRCLFRSCFDPVYAYYSASVRLGGPPFLGQQTVLTTENTYPP